MKKIIPLVLLTSGACFLAGCQAMNVNERSLRQNLDSLQVSLSSELNHIDTTTRNSKQFNYRDYANFRNNCPDCYRTVYGNSDIDFSDDTVLNNQVYELENIFALSDQVNNASYRYNTLRDDLSNNIESTKQNLENAKKNNSKFSKEKIQTLRGYSNDLRELSRQLDDSNSQIYDTNTDIVRLKNNIMGNTERLADSYARMLDNLDYRLDTMERALSTLTMINSLIKSENMDDTTNEQIIIKSKQKTDNAEEKNLTTLELHDEYVVHDDTVNENNNTKDIKEYKPDIMPNTNQNNTTDDTAEKKKTNIDTYKSDKISNLDTYGPDYSNLDTYWLPPTIDQSDFENTRIGLNGGFGIGLGAGNNTNAINNPSSNTPGATTEKKAQVLEDLENKKNQTKDSDKKDDNTSPDTKVQSSDNKNKKDKKALKNIDTYQNETLKANIDTMSRKKQKNDIPNNANTNGNKNIAKNVDTLSEDKLEKTETSKVNLTPPPAVEPIPMNDVATEQAKIIEAKAE